MLASFKKYWLLALVLVLLVVVIYIFYLNFRSARGELIVAMLDIGQGDAFFIESPTGRQILIDAGPPRRVLGELARVMPPFDRRLDAIILTHPDLDHIGGFQDILRNYKVGVALEPGSFNASQAYKNLKENFVSKKIPVVLAHKDMTIHLGGGATLKILFPDRDVSDWTTNDASIIARLEYGENSFMFTGDATKETEKIVLDHNDSLASDFLKVGHHGSKSSTSLEFVKAVDPEYALISVGRDNSYGHPTEEVLDLLDDLRVLVLRTDEDGTIVFKCDKIDPCEIKKLRN